MRLFSQVEEYMGHLLTRENAHTELLRDAVTPHLTEEDALLWMVLLHTHQIRLRPGVMDGYPHEAFMWEPLTQRGAAGVIADLWPDRSDQRADYVYWYVEYVNKMPEMFKSLPTLQQERVADFRDRLVSDPRVETVVEEDL